MSETGKEVSLYEVLDTFLEVCRSEIVEELTLDLGLDGFSPPLAPDLNVESKATDSELCRSYFGESQQDTVGGVNPDSSIFFPRICEGDGKPEPVDLSLTCPVKVKGKDVEHEPTTVAARLPTDVTSERENARLIDGSVTHEGMQRFGEELETAAKQKFPMIGAPSNVFEPEMFQSASLQAGQQADHPILLDGDTDEEAFSLDEGDDDDVQVISFSRMDQQCGQENGYPADPFGAIKTDECDRERPPHGPDSGGPPHGEEEQEWRLSKRSIDPSCHKRVASPTFSCGFDDDEEHDTKRARLKSEEADRRTKESLTIREMESDGDTELAEAFKALYRISPNPPADDSRLAGDPVDGVGGHTVQQDFHNNQDSQPAVSAERTPSNQPSPIQERPPTKQGCPGDVVLYDQEVEAAELPKDVKCAGSGPQVQQPNVEVQSHSRNIIPDIVPFGSLARPNALGLTKSPRTDVFVALHAFDQVRRHIILNPSYGQESTDAEQKPTRLRADLKAACSMRKRGFWLNEEIRPIGEVPGVLVGDRFNYRIEMAVIGLHRATQAGIAVIPASFSPHGVPVASSVVLGSCDPYHDDKDMGVDVVYSGQGGLCGKTKESQDQQLTRGNLALNNSFTLGLPVRLIRGRRIPNGLSAVTYSYDGLYKIHEMQYVDGVKGKKVYLFTMRREPGQAPLSCGGTYPVPLVSQPPPQLSKEDGGA